MGAKRDSKRRCEALIEEACGEHGFRRRHGKKHVVLFAPDGAIFSASATPSDWRAPRNLLAWLRQHGFPRKGA